MPQESLTKAPAMTLLGGGGALWRNKYYTMVSLDGLLSPYFVVLRPLLLAMAHAIELEFESRLGQKVAQNDCLCSEAADQRVLAAGLPETMASWNSRDVTTFIQTMARQQAGILNLSNNDDF